MTELDAQVSLLNFVLAKEKGSLPIFSIETPFCEYKRRADVVAIIDGYTYAFEIKTDSDNLDSLKSQIEDYSKVFDYCYLASEGKNLAIAKSSLARKFGVISLGSVSSQQRIPRQNKRLDKLSILSSIDFNYLKGVVKDRSWNTKQDTVEGLSKTITIEKARSLYVSYLTSRYQQRNELFFSEVGKVIHTDDLLLLSRESSALTLES